MDNRLTSTLIILICFGCNNSKDIGQIGYRNDLTVSDKMGNPTNMKSFYFDPVDFRDTFPIPNLVVEPPYDTIEDINNVPADKMREEFEVKVDSFALEWFSRVLADNHERILSNYFLDKEIYRLTWIRTFHQSVVITIYNDEGKWFIETKWLKYINKDINTSKKEIDADKISKLKSILNEHRFYDSNPYDWGLGNDGSEWIFEAHTSDKYHFINRWSPDVGQSNGLREIGEYLIRNSDAKDEEIY